MMQATPEDDEKV